MLIFVSLKQKLLIFFRLLRPSNVAIGLIKVYKLCLSPYLGNNCRFYPSCSQYAIDAFTKKGFFKGFFLTLLRILRCNPFGKGGYDPVK